MLRILSLTATAPVVTTAPADPDTLFTTRDDAPDVVISGRDTAPALLLELLHHARHIGLVLTTPVDDHTTRLVLRHATAMPPLIGPTAAPYVTWQLRRAYLQALAWRLAWRLEPTAARLGRDLTSALQLALTGQTPGITTMPALATYVGLHLRTLYRRLAEAGYTRPKEFVRVRQVVHLLPELLNCTVPMPAVAARAGFTDYARFRAELQRLTGAGPRAWRYHYDPSAAFPKLLAALCPESPAAPDSAGRSARGGA